MKKSNKQTSKLAKESYLSLIFSNNSLDLVSSIQIGLKNLRLKKSQQTSKFGLHKWIGNDTSEKLHVKSPCMYNAYSMFKIKMKFRLQI